MGEDDRGALSRVFHALGNEHRREIIDLLAVQPRSISQLARLRRLSLPAIHKHIRVLEEAGMVQRRKVARTNILALEREPLVLLQAWIGRFHPWWGTEGESLENYTEYFSNEGNTSMETS